MIELKDSIVSCGGSASDVTIWRDFGWQFYVCFDQKKKIEIALSQLETGVWLLACNFRWSLKSLFRLEKSTDGVNRVAQILQNHFSSDKRFTGISWYINEPAISPSATGQATPFEDSP